MANLKVGEVLSLKAALGGLDDLFKDGGETQFSVRQSAFVPSVGKANWQINQLPRWGIILNKRSGAFVENIELVPPNTVKDRIYGNYSLSKPSHMMSICMGSIMINMKISGTIDTSRLTVSMGKAVCGDAKKQLALELLKKFPPPFNPHEPMLAADSLDYLHIDNGSGSVVYGCSDPICTEIDREINRLLNEAGSILVDLTSVGLYNRYHLVIKWLYDVNDKQRENLVKNIKKLFKTKLKTNPDVNLRVW